MGGLHKYLFCKSIYRLLQFLSVFLPVTVLIGKNAICTYKCLRIHSSAFFPKGHYLVLRPGSALWASGSCTFHIASPVVLSSGPQCRLHLACFQPEPRTGNLSVSIKLTDSSVISSLTSVSRGKAGIRLESIFMVLHSGLKNNLKLYCLWAAQ